MIRTGSLQLTKTTPSGKTAEVYYTSAASVSQRFEVFVDGVSGGVNAGPKTIKVGNTARAAKSVNVIAWGDKFIELTSDEVKELGGIDAPKTAAHKSSRCRVCGGPVRYDEQFARYGYCGCEGQ